MAFGRPTKYLPEMCQMADDYLKSCQDTETVRVKTEGDKSTSYQLGIKVKLPTREGFADFLDIVVSTMLIWEKEYPDFSKALSKIDKEQKERLLNSGLSGNYNPTIAKLILMNNHGMRERTDHTTDGKELPTPIMNYVVQGNDRDTEDHGDDKTSSLRSGGDVGVEDSIDSALPDQPGAV